MIISDDHRFVFVHIPKCAGVSIKRELSAIDSYDGRFLRIAEHPALGLIHHAHIPLADMARHLPQEYAKIRDYRSVAIVRDPIDRFVSALFQRLREFKHFDQLAITPEAFAAEAGEVIRYLESAPPRLDLAHVHFNRQIDYVAHDGARIVRHIFPLAHLDEAAAFVAARTGVAIAPVRRNRSIEVRFAAIRPMLRMLRRPYAALVPYAARNRIRSRLERAGVYGDVAKHRFVRPGGRIDGFVREHYAADFALVASVR